MSEPVEFQVRHGVATIALNRPEKLNAISRAVLHALLRSVESVTTDAAIGVAVLHGRGRAFSAGGDITEMSGMDEAQFSGTIALYMRLAHAFRACPKPIIAAIHGHALAGGFELACLCDIRIAAKDAVLGLPDAAIGLSPTSGMTHILPRLVGLGVAMDLTLSTEPIGAEEAHRIGLVTRVVEPGDLLEQAVALAAKLASFPRTGMARTKPQFYAALESRFAEATAAEHEGEMACYRDPATQAKFKEFVDRKRR